LLFIKRISTATVEYADDHNSIILIRGCTYYTGAQCAEEIKKK